MPADPLPTAAHGAALLVVDMLNDFDFGGGASMRPHALAAAHRIAALAQTARQVGVPVIFANDNYGQWHSERNKLIEHVRASDGREVADTLVPEIDDYFVVKPRHSAFYATSLPVLLPQLKASRLILTGVAADICVLFTAADAHMREYKLWAPRDCVAAEREERRDWALEIMGKAMHAETAASDELALEEWLERDA